MSEVVNALVAFAVIVFIFKWATTGSTSSSDTRSATATLGFRPKHVTQEMVDQIHAMFPDIPTDNVRYDLLRTGSVELTSNKILERGFLEPPPPAYFTLYPRPESDSQRRTTTTTTGTRPTAPPTTATTTARSPPSLIERYHLGRRITKTSPDVIVDVRAEKANDDVNLDVSSSQQPQFVDAGGKAKWEDTAEEREASLRERKAQMVLAARQRLLAQQEKNTSGSASS